MVVEPPRDMDAVAAAMNVSVERLEQLVAENARVRQLVDRLVAMPVVRNLAAQEMARGMVAGGPRRRQQQQKQKQKQKQKATRQRQREVEEQKEPESEQEEVNPPPMTRLEEERLAAIAVRLEEYEAMAKQLKDVIPRRKDRFASVVAENIERMKALRRRMEKMAERRMVVGGREDGGGGDAAKYNGVSVIEGLVTKAAAIERSYRRILRRVDQ
jgi:hypothetical protein